MTSNCFSLPFKPKGNTGFHAGVRYQSGSGKVFVLVHTSCTKLFLDLRKPTPENVNQIFFAHYSHRYPDHTLRQPTPDEARDFLKDCPDDNITIIVSDGNFFSKDGKSSKWQPPGIWYTTKEDYEFKYDYWRTEFYQLFIEVTKP